MEKKYEELQKLKSEKRVLYDEYCKLYKILEERKEKIEQYLIGVFNHYDCYETPGELDSILGMLGYYGDQFQRGYLYYKKYERVCEYIKDIKKDEKDYTSAEVHSLGHKIFEAPEKFDICLIDVRNGKDTLTDYSKDQESFKRFNYRLESPYDLQPSFLIAAICFDFNKLNLFEIFELNKRCKELYNIILNKNEEINKYQQEINKYQQEIKNEIIYETIEKFQSQIDKAVNTGMKCLIKIFSNSNDKNKQ